MKVSIVGSGYVGTTVAACLAHLGHDVVNIDVDEAIVESINAGESPIHEAGLAELIQENAGKRLRATTDYAAVLDTDVTLLCLPTPSDDDGSIDLSAMRAGARSLGETLVAKDGSHVVVVKSTVVPGTTENVVGPILTDASGKSIGDDLQLAMNPEFLREGFAVEDFLHPDKIVVGTADEQTRETFHELYAPLLEETTLVETGIREAEMIKYANNAFLAAKISLVNELGNVCKELDIDSYEVFDAVGLDGRISGRFLRSGLGWGGSCFPKDVDAVRALAREHDYEPSLLDAVIEVNERQPRRAVDLLEQHVDLGGSRVSVLGLAFKPGTDDIRNSRSLDVIDELLTRGADVVAYDPHAMAEARRQFPEIEYSDSPQEALREADAALIATAWEEFTDLDFTEMNRRIVVDGRRVQIDEDSLDTYEGLCW